MKKSRFTETQIVEILKQTDAGVPVNDIYRQAGISVPTYYQWKSKYGGLEASELRRVKELKAENAKLKRTYAELSLDNAALKERDLTKVLRPAQKREAVHVLTQEHKAVLSLHRVVSGGVVQNAAGQDGARCGVDCSPAPAGRCPSGLGVLEVLHVVAQAAFNLESQANLSGI